MPLKRQLERNRESNNGCHNPPKKNLFSKTELNLAVPNKKICNKNILNFHIFYFITNSCFINSKGLSFEFFHMQLFSNLLVRISQAVFYQKKASQLNQREWDWHVNKIEQKKVSLSHIIKELYPNSNRWTVPITLISLNILKFIKEVTLKINKSNHQQQYLKQKIQDNTT